MIHDSQIRFEMTEDQRQLIIERLGERGAIGVCAACGAQELTLHSSLTKVNLQSASRNNELGGPTVPAAIVICARCGNLRLHALGVLGLLTHPKFDLGGEPRG